MKLRPTWSGRATPDTRPLRTARKKFVFDSTVAVAAPAGRWRNAQTPPSVSAKAISAPPWRTPPAVQRSGAHGSVPRTSSGSAETISIPSRPASGTDAARSCSANPQRPPAGLAHLRHPFRREPAREPVPELREELVGVPAPVGMEALASFPRSTVVHCASAVEEGLARGLLITDY